MTSNKKIVMDYDKETMMSTASYEDDGIEINIPIGQFSASFINAPAECNAIPETKNKPYERIRRNYIIYFQHKKMKDVKIRMKNKTPIEIEEYLKDIRINGFVCHNHINQIIESYPSSYVEKSVIKARIDNE